jgi:hypothetical protein
VINSKKLKNLSEKLEAIDNIIGLLYSGGPVEMEFGGSMGVWKIVVSLSADATTNYDLSKEVAVAFEKFRGHLEREIKSLVRP